MEYFFNFEKIAYLRTEKPSGCILCLVRDQSDQVRNLTVFENELVNISMNLYPYNPGHLLVFPLRHVEDLRNLAGEEESAIATAVKTSIDILERLYAPSAFNYGCNMGLDAGASIRHLHYHIIPRYPHETGIADLIAGKRVLVEDPMDSMEKVRKAFSGAI